MAEVDERVSPRTEAGRAFSLRMNGTATWMGEAIVAIETEAAGERASRTARVVARLPRMLTEADDYSWVPLGDVLLAVLDIDAAEEWSEGEPLVTMDTLVRWSALLDAAREVVRLGNQPGLDDDEWEAAFTALEEAAR